MLDMFGSHPLWIFTFLIDYFLSSTLTPHVILTVVFLENANDGMYFGDITFHMIVNCTYFLKGEAQLLQIFFKLPVDNKPCVSVVHIKYISEQFQSCI